MFCLRKTYNTDRSHTVVDTAGSETALDNFKPTAWAKDDVASWNPAISEDELTVAVWGI